MVSVKETAVRLFCTGDREELRAIREHFRFRPDGYFHSQKFTIYTLTEGKEGWDGYIYPFQVTGQYANVTGMVLRGRLPELLAFCKRKDIEVDLSGLLPRPLANLSMQDVPPDIVQGAHELDERQRRTIHQWLIHGYGVGHMAVNSGKTMAFAGAAAMVRQHYPSAKMLYITFTERLVNQARKDFKTFLPAENISQYGGGKHDKDGDLVLTTASMLGKHFRELLLSKWFNRFMCVMYDEVHHCGADTSKRVLEAIPAYFRFGASGSVKEDDPGRSADIKGYFGPVRNTVKQVELVAEGRSAKPRIYTVDMPGWHNKFSAVPYRVVPSTPMWALVEGVWRRGTYLGPVIKLDDNGKVVRRKQKIVEDSVDMSRLNRVIVERHPPENEDDVLRLVTIEEDMVEPGLNRAVLEGEEGEYHIESRWCLLNRVYDRAITRFKERNELVCQWAKHYSGQGHPTVVVCTRTLHIHILYALISAVVKPDLIRTLYGEDSTTKRDDCFDWFRHTPGSIMITPLVKEGVSISQIRAGVVADYVADYEAADQIVGRFIRKKQERNVAEITWFVDRQHPSLRRGCLKMLARLAQVEGYEFRHGVNTPADIPVL